MMEKGKNGAAEYYLSKLRNCGESGDAVRSSGLGHSVCDILSIHVWLWSRQLSVQSGAQQDSVRGRPCISLCHQCTENMEGLGSG